MVNARLNSYCCVSNVSTHETYVDICGSCGLTIRPGSWPFKCWMASAAGQGLSPIARTGRIRARSTSLPFGRRAKRCHRRHRAARRCHSGKDEVTDRRGVSVGP
jgi:hypothetical protein